MTTRRWTKTQPTAAERQQAARAKALDQCRKGYHSLTPTFRPGEQVCMSCGLVVYCSTCLDRQNLQVVNEHTFPLLCVTHRNAEVKE